VVTPFFLATRAACVVNSLRVKERQDGLALFLFWRHWAPGRLCLAVVCPNGLEGHFAGAPKLFLRLLLRAVAFSVALLDRLPVNLHNFGALASPLESTLAKAIIYLANQGTSAMLRVYAIA